MSAIRQIILSCSRSVASPTAELRTVRGMPGAFLLFAGIAGCLGAARPPLTPPPRLDGVVDVPAMRAVPGEFVVIFGDGIAGVPLEGETRADAARRRIAETDSEAAETAAIRAGGRIQYRYRDAVIGFAGNLPPEAIEAIIRATRDRAKIEPNWKAHQGTDEYLPVTAMKTAAGLPPLSPGLDRIGQRLLKLNGVFQPPAPGGREVHVYVIDSGIRATHSQFARASGSGSRVGNSFDAYITPPTDRCARHGTHVAGTIGGKTVGVAPFVELHSVRVIDCSDTVTLAAAILGVDWVLKQYRMRPKSSIANMSLEFYAKLPSLDSAVNNSITAGITYVIAAGNHNQDACKVSPARVVAAITVASVDPETDKNAGTSGGTCVDLFAPGKVIVSATSSSDAAWDVQNGTSSAAPHAAGVAAIYLSRVNAGPAAVWAALLSAANVIPGTSDWCGVLNRGATTHNRLLHWGAGLPPDGKTDAAGESPLKPSPTCPKK